MCLHRKALLPGTDLWRMKLRQGLAEAGMYATTRIAGSALQA